MLYWLKRGLVKTRQEIAHLLNRNDSTVTRWLNDYRDGGLRQLLEIKTAPGAARVIPPGGDGPSESAFSGTDGISEL